MHLGPRGTRGTTILLGRDDISDVMLFDLVATEQMASVPLTKISVVFQENPMSYFDVL